MAGNDENNPYTVDEQNPNQHKTKLGDADHIVTREDLEKANVKGADNPALKNGSRSDAEIMSGERDKAGIPMNMAQKQATENNDKILASQGEQLAGKTGHTTEDGKFIPTPPNTPSV